MLIYTPVIHDLAQMVFSLKNGVLDFIRWNCGSHMSAGWAFISQTIFKEKKEKSTKPNPAYVSLMY
jgi:hypothetical protein